MSVFFQFISAFALFFGIAGLVYATEVSKRCQQMIAGRFGDIETQLASKLHKQDLVIQGVAHELRRMVTDMEESQLSQVREINALRKALEPLVKDLETRVEENKRAKITASHRTRRS